MDVRQLKVLLAVIENGALAKAAERLHLSQSAVTKIIQRFEEELGVALFIRRARGMFPTEYASALVVHAQNATASLAQAVKDIESLRTGSNRTVSVATSPVIGDELLPESIRYMAEEDPLIKLKVSLEPAESLNALVLDEKVDFAIGILGEVKSNAGLRQQLLFHDRMVIVARNSHPLAQACVVQPNDLGQQDWVVPDERSLNRHRLQYLFDAWKLPLPKIAVECRSPALAKKLLLRTNYLSLLSGLAAKDELESGLLSAIEVHGANFDRPVGLVWSKTKPLSSASLIFIKHIKRVCDEMGLARNLRIVKR